MLCLFHGVASPSLSYSQRRDWLVSPVVKRGEACNLVKGVHLYRQASTASEPSTYLPKLCNYARAGQGGGGRDTRVV